MLFPEWQRRVIVVFSRRVHRELTDLDMDLWDVKYILEFGFNCLRGKRRKEIIERCIRKGKKVIKVVVQESESEIYGKIWLLRHVGMIGIRREWKGL